VSPREIPTALVGQLVDVCGANGRTWRMTLRRVQQTTEDDGPRVWADGVDPVSGVERLIAIGSLAAIAAVTP
jgi:hypothetical protein